MASVLKGSGGLTSNPLDAAKVFPLSRDSILDKMSRSRSINSAILMRYSPLWNPGALVPQVVLNAFRAALTATSTSAARPSGMGQMTSPVVGLMVL